MKTSPGGRVPELDAVRAFAAILVLLYHSGFSTGRRLADVPIKMGWTSVDLFFLLSGYLITSIILSYRVDRTFLAAFYARRGLRIWPIYYLAILILTALSRSGIMPPTWPPFTPRLVLHYLTFTQAIPSYWGDHSAYYHPIGHFWSLAVEEQFYLLWPFLIFLVGRRGIVPISIAFIATAIIAREWGGIGTRHVLMVRCDGLAFGAILAVLVKSETFQARKRLYACVFAVIAAVSLMTLAAWTVLISHDFFWSNSVLLCIDPFYFGAIGLIVCCAGQSWLAPLRIRWLCYLGQISYGLYLYHFIIYALVDHLAGDGTDGPRHLPIKLALTIAVAAISWEFFEKPILSWKDRFPYAGSDRPATELECAGTTRTRHF